MAPELFCSQCVEPLTAEEVHYYEDRCERCERLWFYRVEAWRRGGNDTELDGLYQAPPR